VETGTGASHFIYGYYLNPQFKIYFEEMVRAFAKKLRIDLAATRQATIVCVRADTGATGDESAYENPTLIPAQYQISAQDWEDYRVWVFEIFRQAFHTGPGPIFPILYKSVSPEDNPQAWTWIIQNMPNGFGAKYEGLIRAHHLTFSESVPRQYKPVAVDSNYTFFSRTEMDQTWTKPYYQLNVELGMYWMAAETLNAGLGIWDWTGTCLEGAVANGFRWVADFFNTWAAELDPTSARGGFCIFLEGLDSMDTVKFPDNFAGTGSASKTNTARYTAICNAYSAQGAQMDDLAGAVMLQVAQRDKLKGFNDAGWGIHPGNYDRFLTQIDPSGTSLGLWRINGTLTNTSHPFNRFARRFDYASGRNAMYFDLYNRLSLTPGQTIMISVTYLDIGIGQFGISYDAGASNSQKRALTVTKTNTLTWKTASVNVSDWVFGNNGPSGSDI
jgi:hypothetical protein